MLAVVRIGAIHSVVFAGFGARALSDRIVASGSRLVVTADVTYRKGKSVPLSTIVDEALQLAPNAVEHVVVLWREGSPAEAGLHNPAEAGLYRGWEEFLLGGEGQSSTHVEMEANEPAYILATSGT